VPRGALDFTPQYRGIVVQYFNSCGSLRKTAAKFQLSARLVNEILHVHTLRKPVDRALAPGRMVMAGAA
jgi:hypothetical protein